MQFRVLGPFEVLDSAGQVVKLDRRQARFLLAILAIEAGRPVPVNRLCELVWDGNPPGNARDTLRTYMTRIRRALADAKGSTDEVSLVATPRGYRLDVPTDLVDAHRFRSLVERAHATASPTERVRLLHEGLALWRGPALADAPERLRQLCADLDEMRLGALATLLSTSLDLGRHNELLPELARLTAQDPGNERLVYLHMLALYRADRRTEALDLYTRTRAYLAEQLGLEPGARLRELHQAILRGLPLPPLAADSGSEPATDGRTNAPPPDSPVSNDLADLVDAVLRLAPGLAPGRRPQPLGRTEIRLFRWSDPAGPACRLGITTGTIRRVKHADIWVNSENTDMEMSRHTDFSVSGIIRYFGARRDRSGRVTEDLIADELANLVAGRRPVAPASAIVTGAGALADSHNVAYVIHVAAVFGTPGAGFRQVANVGDCVTNALTEADRLAATGKRAHSIVFPLLGAGSAGAAALPTAVALVNAAVDYLTGTPGTALRAVHFLAYSADELTVLEQAIAAIPELVPDEG